MSKNTKRYVLASPHRDANGKSYVKGSIIELTDKQAEKLVNKVTLVMGATVDGEVITDVEVTAEVKKPAKAKPKKADKAKNDDEDNNVLG